MNIKVIRSRRRRRTVSARIVAGALELRVPFFLPKAKIDHFIGIFRKKIQRRHITKNDGFLNKRSKDLYKRFLVPFSDKGDLDWTICWSAKQRRIFGICNHRTHIIRISTRLKPFPLWVLDYVIVHELGHLFYPNHSKDFWRLVKRYPKTDKARGFLEGVSFEEKAE